MLLHTDPLTGEMQSGSEFGSGRLTLEALSTLAKGVKPHLNFMLRPYADGYALWYDLKRTFGIPSSGWLIAERSKQIRVFANVETAIRVAARLGLHELRVEIPETPTSHT